VETEAVLVAKDIFDLLFQCWMKENGIDICKKKNSASE
jgi:hypothetical protein